MSTTPSPTLASSLAPGLAKALPGGVNAGIDDLELAALISSRICHDIINPVGAIYNGLEVLDDDNDEQSRAYALEVIRDFTIQASAKVQFARFAFGAAGSAGSLIELGSAEQIARGFLGGRGKHKLTWAVPAGHMAKDRVKLLLNLIACAVTALPRGGEIVASVSGRLEDPSMDVRCIGPGARLPQHLREFLTSPETHKIDALSVQPYYTTRLAKSSGLKLSVGLEGLDVVMTAVR
jgi:histidine phosphotransferase ChpT